MSASDSCDAAPEKRTLSSLLAGRVAKRPKREDAGGLQQAAIQLLEQQQNICALLGEVGDTDPWNVLHTRNGEQKPTGGVPSAASAALLVRELRRRAGRLGVPAAALSVTMVVERLKEIVGEGEDEARGLLTSSQRVQLCGLLESSRELLSRGALCPKLLWQEYRRDQSVPDLEVVCHLHFYNILTLRHIIESDEDARPWLVSQLKALCGWTPARGGEETKKMLSTVVGVLVGSGFELSPRPAAADRKAQLLCCSALDDLLFWLLDTVERGPMPRCAAAELWLEVFDASLCGVSASGETLQRFFTHSLTQTLTYKPQLTVSDAVALQNEWTFAKSNALLTSLFRKLAVVFGVEQLLRHLRRVLETREVNWKHVLCFLSTLLVCNPGAQLRLRELLSGLLSSAFEGYDLESMITAFLLARQGALEGPAVFPSYGSWFKMSFGGGSGPHAASKKSLVFLLKFLSDLVPFEPPQYLKVHILQSPYVPVKHRSLLMEYVSLAKTRLADLKEPVEDMGLYEDVSGEGAASLQGQAVQDVEKAVSLFESTGRISATVMEASIFRRPYFLTRFLPALLRPRTLPVQADARTSFIEALRKADKVPAAQYSQYVESCQKRRHEDAGAACSDTADEPVEALSVQLQELTQLLDEGSEGELSARLSRIAHTLSAVFPGGPVELPGRRATVSSSRFGAAGEPAPFSACVGVQACLSLSLPLSGGRRDPEELLPVRDQRLQSEASQQAKLLGLHVCRHAARQRAAPLRPRAPTPGPVPQPGVFAGRRPPARPGGVGGASPRRRPPGSSGAAAGAGVRRRGPQLGAGLRHARRHALLRQVVRGCFVLRDLQRGRGAAGAAAGLRPQRLLQEAAVPHPEAVA